MSDNMMSVDRARRLTDGGRHTTHSGWVMPAARTIVHQAEQIERLQAALRQADQDAFWASADRYVGPGSLTYEEPDWGTYDLLPGDMEAPE